MAKKLFKTSSGKMLDGVCAGLAEYANLDATVVRVVFAIGTLVTGVVPGLVLYVALAIIMPRKA